MKIITDDIWLCTDCTQAAVNDDYTSLDYYYDEVEAALRMKEIQRGLTALGPNLVIGDEEDEFSQSECDCCGSDLGGARFRFAILGN